MLTKRKNGGGGVMRIGRNNPWGVERLGRTLLALPWRRGECHMGRGGLKILAAFGPKGNGTGTDPAFRWE